MESKESQETDTVWYFAIASMMNKISITNRNVHPIESKPAEILDFDLEFFGESGMAVAIMKKGKSFHGVLHRLSLGDMKILDGIEISYERIPSKARLYDGTIMDCYVYGDPN